VGMEVQNKYDYANKRYSHIEAYLGLMVCPIGQNPYCKCAKIDEYGNECHFDFKLDNHSYYNGLKYHRPLDSYKSDELMILVVGCLASDNSQEIIILTELKKFSVITEESEYLNEETYRFYNLKLYFDQNSISIDMPLWQTSNNFIKAKIKTKIERKALLLYLEKVSNGIFEYLPDNEQLKNIRKIVKYVDSLEISSIFKSYKVVFNGYFKRIVGKDDQYLYSYERTINTDDIYIRSLFNLDCVNDYYSCVGRGPEERDVTDEVQYDTMDVAVNYALKRYTKESHIAYLVLNFYKEVQKRTTMEHEIDSKIRSLYY
jgi:hypothetical protein